MASMLMQSRVIDGRRYVAGPRPNGIVAGATALVLAMLLLVALMPGFAGTGGSSVGRQPAPLPAPAPSYGAPGLSFPAQP